MRTDRELLELAAKAAGLVTYDDYDDNMWAHRADQHPDEACHWNPMIDDGDALRLAVKLSLRVEARPDGHIYVWSGEYLMWRDFAFNEHVDHEREAAMRRAIVNTAAEIGAHPKQHNDGGADAR